MRNFRLSRRAVLRGAGGVAVALPWLEVMAPQRTLRAASSPAQRFLAVYQPGGTVLSKWRPTGSENAVTLSPILAPFEPLKEHLLIVDGVDMTSAIGEQNQSGMVALLTGTAQAAISQGGFAQGPSVDQAIATRLSPGRKFKSLEMAVRWGTGKSHGLLSPIDALNFADTSAFTPIAPRLDPVKIWNELFGEIPATAGANVAWDRSILDAVDRRYAALALRLGAADKARIDQHLSKIREVEQALATSVAGRCLPPPVVDGSNYNPLAGLNSANDGSVVDALTDAAIPKVGKAMIDMMVMAFACDLTAVGTLQWSDSEAKHTFPWLGLNQTYAFYQNDGGYQPTQCEQICTWYSQQHAYLLQQMATIDMGGHSLLDESVVFFGSHIQEPPTHKKNNMPFLLAGHGGGLRPGRWVTYPHPSHNNLLVSILNLFGDDRMTFGNPAYCTGALTNLT